MAGKLALSSVAMLALAGCAVTNTPYPRAPGGNPYPSAHRPAPVQNIYSNAPRAPLHGELFACNTWGSNLGEIGLRGETVLYTPYIQTPAGPLLRNPTQSACLSSGFGWRNSSGRQHNGLDLANPEGGFVYAAGDGRVIRADYFGGYGNTVEIDHGNDVRTLYAHLSEIDQNLYRGATVAAGAPIARMGMTGNATGVHLHYEVWVGGLLVDPLHYGRPPIYVSAPAPEPIPLPDDVPAEAKPTY